MQRTAASKRARQKALKLRQSPSVPVTDLDPEPESNNLPKLPDEVLITIYKLTLIREFYKLRVVCKDWNKVACERRCFTDRIPKPYFVLIQHKRPTGMKDCPSGTLAFNVSSGKWIWKPFKANPMPKHVSYVPDLLRYHRFDPVGHILEPFAQEGILFGRGYYHPSLLAYKFHSIEQTILFNVQAGRKILDFVTLVSEESRTVGMMVDISRKPRHTVKVIVGSYSEGTQIYDSESKTSETKPSRMVRGPSVPDPEAPTRSSPKSCISCKGRMYVWADLDEIQVYSIEKDEWSILNPPPSNAEHDAYRGLGHWEEEVYAVTRTEEATLTVWKLNGATQEWSEFDRIPPELWAHLQPKAKEPRKMAQFVVVSHCSEYLLMHGATHGKARQKHGGRRYVLFNISNKRWEKVEMKEQEGRARRH